MTDTSVTFWWELFSLSDGEDEIEKKQLIAKTAVEVFAKKGFTETSVQHIADEAGIGKGTVYLYFDNKSDILYEVFLNFEEMLHNILDRVLEDADDPAETANQLMTQLIDMLQSNPAMFSVLFDFWSQGLNSSEQFEIPFKPFYNRVRKKFELLIDDLVDQDLLDNHSLEEISYVLIGIFEGQMVQWLMNPSSPPLEKIQDIVLRILFEGITSDFELEGK